MTGTTVCAKCNLQHDVVHGIPVRHSDLSAAKLREILDLGVLADDKARAVRMGPRHDLYREIVVVTHPNRNRLEEVHQVELVGREAFDQGRPAANQGWLGNLQALLLKIPLGMRDKQCRSVRDRQIADAYDVVLRRRLSRRGKRRGTGSRETPGGELVHKATT